MTQDDSTKFDSDKNYYAILHKLEILKNKIIENPLDAKILRIEILEYIFSENIIKQHFIKLIESIYKYQFGVDCVERGNNLHNQIKTLFNLSDAETYQDCKNFLYFPSLKTKYNNFGEDIKVCSCLMNFYSIIHPNLHSYILTSCLYDVEYCVISDGSFVNELRTKFDMYYLATCLKCTLESLKNFVEYEYCRVYYQKNTQLQQKASSFIKKIKDNRFADDLMKIVKEIIKNPSIKLNELATELKTTEDTVKNRLREITRIDKKTGELAGVKKIVNEMKSYLKNLI